MKGETVKVYKKHKPKGLYFPDFYKKRPGPRIFSGKKYQYDSIIHHDKQTLEARKKTLEEDGLNIRVIKHSKGVYIIYKR